MEGNIRDLKVWKESWEMRICCLMFIEFQSCRLKIFWRFVFLQCDYISRYWTVHLKMVNFILCIFIVFLLKPHYKRKNRKVRKEGWGRGNTYLESKCLNWSVRFTCIQNIIITTASLSLSLSLICVSSPCPFFCYHFDL